MRPPRALPIAAAILCAAFLAAVARFPPSWAGEEPAAGDGELAAAERLSLLRAYGPALSILDELRSAARKRGDRRLESASVDLIAIVHDNQGLGRLAAGEHAEALALATALGDPGLEARALAHEALGYWMRAEYAPARERCERALAMQRQVGDRRGEAQTLVYRGLIHFKAGEYGAAEADLKRALALQEGAGDRLAQARTWGALAQVDRDRHQLAAALERYRRALEIAEAAGDAGLAGDMRIDIGVTYIFDGADGDAVAQFQRALETASHDAGEGAAAARGRALHHLGIAYSQRGWYDRALECFAAALEVQEAMGDLREAAWSLERIGRVHARRGDDRQALAAYRRAMALREEIADRRALASQLNDVAVTYERLGDDRQARATLRRAESLAREIRLPYLSLTLGLRGRLEARLGDGAAAIGLGESAVTEADKTTNLQMRWRAHYDLGAIQLALGRREAALASWRRALALIEELRHGAIAEDEAKAAYMESKQEVYAAAVRLLVEMGQPEEALELAERARARSFLDLLGGRSSTLDGAGKVLADVAPPKLAELRALARQRDQTMVEYFLTGETVFIWVVSPDGSLHTAASPVAAGEIGDLVDGARRALRADLAAREWRDAEDVAVFGEARAESAPGPAPVSPLRRLHQLLIEPVAPWLPGDARRPLVIVPHGKLFLLSFAALRDADDRYLVERHALHYAPAISVLRYTAAPQIRPALDLLVVGNPSMPRLPGRSRPLPPLPGAELEARTIAGLYARERVTTLTGSAAGEREVRRLAERSAIFHLATHGVVRDDDPLESLLALAPAAGGGADDDGLWTAREVFDLRLSASLVTLSACDTGLGKVNGDGVIGLSRAFLYAGAPSVLVSLWRVADGVTRFEMERFYRALLANRGDKAAALRQAQLDTIGALRAGALRGDSGRQLDEDPAYWAPFVLVGEAR